MPLPEAALIDQINAAFDGVVLGVGISLNMAKFVDSCGIATKYAQLAETDERHDWRQISDEALETSAETFCFTDLLGYRFYLAPYMIWTLRNHRHSDNIIADYTIYALDPTRHQFEEITFVAWFTSDQLAAIISFLEYCADEIDTLDDTQAQNNLAAIRSLMDESKPPLGG